MHKRSPLLGGIIAAAFIGFGGWRLYDHFVLGTPMPTWRLILTVAIIAYGLFVAYSTLTAKKGDQQ